MHIPCATHVIYFGLNFLLRNGIIFRESNLLLLFVLTTYSATLKDHGPDPE